MAATATTETEHQLRSNIGYLPSNKMSPIAENSNCNDNISSDDAIITENNAYNKSSCGDRQ